MKVVAFDPGVREVGVSEWAQGALVLAYVLPRMKDYGAYLGKLGELAQEADVFVIEDQYAGVAGIISSKLPKFKKTVMAGSIVKSTIQVAKVGAEILIYGVQQDCEVHEVLASSWQSIFVNVRVLKLLGIKTKLPRKTRAQLKKSSTLMASIMWGEVVKDHNIADAICMGYKWHLDQGFIN